MKTVVLLLFVASVLAGCSGSGDEAKAPAGAMPPISKGNRDESGGRGADAGK